MNDQQIAEQGWKDDVRWLGRTALIVVGGSALVIFLIIGVRKPWEKPDTGGLPGWCSAATAPPVGDAVSMQKIIQGATTPADAMALSLSVTLADTPENIKPIEARIKAALDAIAAGEQPETDLAENARLYDEEAVKACS